MPCKFCPHCRNADLTALLILHGRPVAGLTPDSNRGFYRAFAAAYDLARARSGNPRALIMEANPDLTPSQYREYLKRARAFGYVATPGRAQLAAGRVQPDQPAPAPAAGVDGLDDDMRRWLADARAAFPNGL